MRLFNEKHETILNCDFRAINPNGHSSGDIIPHKVVVESLIFYYQDQNDGGFRRIQIPKEMIMDLAKQIEESESIIQDQKFLDLPF